MRHALFIVTLLIPSICASLGADSQEFVGISRDGKLVVIGFVSDPEEWTGGNWIYGSLTSARLRYCWRNEAPIDSSDPSSRYHTHFVCASTHGQKPTVFYERGNLDWQKHTGLRYAEAMADFDRATRAGYERTKEYIGEYYFCDAGCDSSMPAFIFEVSFED